MRGSIFMALAVFQIHFLVAQDVLNIPSTQAQTLFEMGKHVAVWKDTTLNRSFAEIHQANGVAKFVPSNDSYVQLSPVIGVWWLRFTLQGDMPQRIWLRINQPAIDTLDFYYPNTQGIYEMRRLGVMLPSPKGTMLLNGFWFEIPNITPRGSTYYLRVSAHNAPHLPIQVGDLSRLIHHWLWDSVPGFLYIGFALGIVFYALFSYFNIQRDHLQLFYMGYVVCMVLYVVHARGIYYILFPGWHEWFADLNFPAITFSIIFFNRFTVNLFNLQERERYIVWVMLVIEVLLVLNLGVFAAQQWGLISRGYTQLNVLSLLNIFLLLWLCVRAARHPEVQSVRYYLVGMLLFLLVMGVYSLMATGVLPYWNEIRQVALLASALEFLCFTQAITLKYRTFRQEREAARMEIMRLTQQHNLQLQEAVEHQTAELKLRYEKIYDQNQELQEQQRLILLKTRELEAHRIHLEKVNRRMHTNEGILRKAYEMMKEREETIKNQNHILEEKNAEIETQNEELRQQREEVSTLAEHLEQLVVQRTAELQKTVEELSAKNENLEQFSHIVSHNLRAPVARIQGLLSLFNHEKPDEPFNTQILNLLQQSSHNLDGVLKDLTHIISTQNSLDKPREEIRLEQLAQIVVEGLRDEILKADAYIELKIASDLVFYGIRSYLHSILHNLISNAIKYRAPGRQARIEVKTMLEDSLLSIAVCDNGLGIDLSKTDLYKIFGLYQRLHTHIEGKGLGLYLVKTQVEAMQGKISVESQLDVGSTFTVSLPINDSSQ